MAEGLSFRLTGTAAQNIALEAQADGISPVEWVRRAVGAYSVQRSVERDIAAHFPDGAAINYIVAIGAIDEETSRLFEFTPDMTSHQATQVTLIDERPKDQ